MQSSAIHTVFLSGDLEELWSRLFELCFGFMDTPTILPRWEYLSSRRMNARNIRPRLMSRGQIILLAGRPFAVSWYGFRVCLVADSAKNSEVLTQSDTCVSQIHQFGAYNTAARICVILCPSRCFAVLQFLCVSLKGDKIQAQLRLHQAGHADLSHNSCLFFALVHAPCAWF